MILRTRMSEATNPEVNSLPQRVAIHPNLSFGETLSAPYKNSSSNTNGTATAIKNGQPTSAPVANATVANNVRLLFLLVVGSMKCAKAMTLKYMAKDEGRKAMDAFHMPTENSMRKKR